MKLIHGDCLEELKKLPENSVDSIVTDPPYELGFMGKSWDKSGIANNVEMWKECLRVLKPGGHLLAFSGTRTYHRMASAIEGAGFEVRDMIEWVYGSGFPKSLNIGKKVDKLQGNKREELADIKPAGFKTAASGYTDTREWSGKVTKGTSEWEGWRTALKPAHEPICMARKPISEKTIAENCLKWGTGGINIDDIRVGNDVIPAQKRGNTVNVSFQSGGFTEEHIGRFPANLIHDNSEEVRECFPESKSTGGTGEKSKGKMGTLNWEGQATGGFGDSGNASRFFKSIIYQAKASKRERNMGCEGLEEKETKRYGDFEGTPEHAPKLNVKNTNNHPTVKPVALMEYLIKMVTRNGGTVLDPFMGSGSTGVACEKNGFDFVGIEREKDYIEIASARISAVNP